MSVPKDKRKIGELAVNTAARSICTHILKITGNDKKFPPDQLEYTNRMRDLALQIDLDCWEANNIRVGNSKEKYDDRLRLQEKAKRECTNMLEMINIAQPLYHMSTKRYEYLTEQYTNLRSMITSWEESNKRRLNPERV